MINNIGNKKEVKEILQKENPTGVIHFAADKAVNESVVNPMKYYQNNVLNLINFLEVIDKRNYELTNDLIEDRAYNMLYARKYDEELENTLRTMRAEAFVEFKNLD